MLKTMVIAAVLMMTGAAMGQTANQQSHAMKLIAQAAQIHDQHPEAAEALLAHSAQVITETPTDNAGLIFIDKTLEEGCGEDIALACKLLIEDISVDHYVNLQAFFDGYCNAGAKEDPTTQGACAVRDSLKQTLNANGIKTN